MKEERTFCAIKNKMKIYIVYAINYVLLIIGLYKRTANNTKRKEHIIWDHFDVDHELCRARCLNCNSTISATSYVMKRHFQYKHPVVYKTIEEEEGRIKFLLETNPDVLHALSTNENRYQNFHYWHFLLFLILTSILLVFVTFFLKINAQN